jgi:hypothetical protein
MQFITPIEDAETPGELAFAKFLKKVLSEDDRFLCWNNIKIREKKGKHKDPEHPDFILFHPRYGLWILEVKDWELSYIQRHNEKYFYVGDNKRTKNPYDQAWKQVRVAAHLLEADKKLIEKDGNLLFPWACGVVFPNLSRKDFETGQLGESIAPHLAICSDEMGKTTTAETLIARLTAMMRWQAKKELSKEQVDRVRYDIFPDITIPVFAGNKIKSDIPYVMDIEQEKLARNLGGGHRVIHGVAGSGKTVILLHRAMYLAEQPDMKPILLLCRGKYVGSRLKEIAKEKGIDKKIQVFSFHKWCKYLLDKAGLDSDIGSDPDRLAEKVISGIAEGKIKQGQYGAILLDEGHDFREKPEWLKLIVGMLRDKESPFLFAYDDAQSIYDRSITKDFSFKSVGINAQGRTSILRKNYRNTEEILFCAKRFASSLLVDKSSDNGEFEQIRPEGIGNRGPLPLLIECEFWKDESKEIIKALKSAHAKGMPWQQMAVLFHKDWIGKDLKQKLNAARIPNWLEDRQNWNYEHEEDTVKLLPIIRAKGLEFDLVCIPRLSDLPQKEEESGKTKFVNPDRDMRLIYNAITRCMKELVITYETPKDGSQSRFVTKLQTALMELRLSENQN